ncbi:MAG: hypothetical protein GWN93_14570, partial [Deltaproteobacteria bacterium]|nr:hypothetical protein [Deltaproteobacteria bacterium]
DPNNPNMTALLESSCITGFSGYSDAEVSFWYHMLGTTQMGTLYVDVTTNCTSPSWTNEFSVSGDQGDTWHQANVDLTSYLGGEVKLRFRGVTGSGWSSDIAIDDVLVTAAVTTGVCGDGTVDAGEDCDDGNTNDGDCCSSTCQYESAATVCRAAAGVCDASGLLRRRGHLRRGREADERVPCLGGRLRHRGDCDGVNNDCPADVVEPVTTECRAAAGVCDAADNCDGVSGACPADGKLTSECRASAGICDIAESCDGVNNDCPADAFEPVTTVCRAAAGVCDAADNCDGAG